MIEKFWQLIRSIVEWCLKLLFKVFHKDLTESVIDGFMQFVKFGIVGVSNTVISYVVYLAVLFSFQKMGWLPKADYFIANVLAFILSVLWSFYWNNKFVFKQEEGEKRSIWKTLLKTYMSYAFSGLILTNVLSVLWIEVLHISKVIAPLINLVVSVPLNFILNKFWAFREKKR